MSLQTSIQDASPGNRVITTAAVADKQISTPTKGAQKQTVQKCSPLELETAVRSSPSSPIKGYSTPRKGSQILDCLPAAIGSGAFSEVYRCCVGHQMHFENHSAQDGDTAYPAPVCRHLCLPHHLPPLVLIAYICIRCLFFLSLFLLCIFSCHIPVPPIMQLHCDILHLICVTVIAGL